MYFVHKYYHETLAGNDEKRHNFTELFRRKQLNLGHARLCIHDQATTHYDEIIDHMTAGMRLAFDLFEEEPRVGWAMDAFGHSYTNTVILRQFGIKAQIADRINENERSQRINQSRLEFHWGSEDFLM